MIPQPTADREIRLHSFSAAANFREPAIRGARGVAGATPSSSVSHAFPHRHTACNSLRGPNKLEVHMGSEDVVAGKVKQAKGKFNDVAGAVKGDTAQQIKGKIEKGVGKVQEALGKGSSDSSSKE
jgi:uncharacterized protein YjbJ (UPF0337 family)